MQIEQTIALVTGANRGIGRALTLALVQAGIRKVYAAGRDPKQLETLVAQGEGKIVALTLDVTNPDQVAEAAKLASDVTLLVNNAGVLASGSALLSTMGQLERDLATNYFGALAVTRAFLPALERSHGGIVNILSVVSLAAMPALGGYSASKAAAWSMTQALRGELAARNVRVYAVFPGPIDTDMSREITLPKTSPEVVASAIVSGVASDQLDIFPDPMSQTIRETWSTSPEALTRQFASM
jgi:NAD(P)-dependent dehydrogenase (short-subunit alcohol dehydrogenase family)